ncbi:MAG TPA: GNAT family protein [Luteitalea sp.]|nr:GNAT family protein [Luteitalea sp.]
MITIRDTTAADVPALAALVGAVARERRYLGTVDGFTDEQTASYLTHVRAGGGVHLVAVDGTRLVGWIDILEGPYEGLRHYGRLGMGLAEDARGRGLGAQLLQRALDDGFTRFERIELEVFASNARAVALYRRLGFVDEGCRRQARVIDDAPDDILMFGLLRDEWRALTPRE